MELSNPNSKNILMELESLKSKESIFKMKEINYIKDKEILEDSIKTLQKDLQEKSETIRSLRKDLDSQSLNLYRDLTNKNDELERTVLENNDLTKKLTIAMETIDHYTKRNDKLKSEFETQKRNYERESECKSRLVGFFENSCSQKDTKISSLSTEVNCLKSTLTEVDSQFQNQKKINEELQSNIIRLNNLFSVEKKEKEQELHRAKLEIQQLQQNGISELHLEKLNPVAATTIKTLKSSKNLMDIYTELHAIISERDFLNLEKSRLIKNKEELEAQLFLKETEIKKFSIESDELHKLTDSLKSRLLSLVSDLRTSETKKGKNEREVLLARRKLEISEKEIVRLMEQVRILLLTGGNGESIKQEPVDVDSALYTSVQELQEVNRVLRNDNDNLRSRLEESDSEQFKQRCNELQLYSDNLKAEVEHLRHQNTSSNNLLLIHERQVKMLRYLIELKSPGSETSIAKALKSLEEGIKSNVEIVDESEESGGDHLLENVTEIIQDNDSVAKLENDITEILDNKRASDQVYLASIESMRADFVNKNRLYIDLSGKLGELKDQFNEEREVNEKYRKESELLRSINKNLSHTTSALEVQIEEFKLKLECKISQLAEKKAELDSCKTQLESYRSQVARFRNERDEFKSTLNKQDELLININTLQNMANLKDHLCLSNFQHKLEVLDKTVLELNTELKEKCETINVIQAQLDESKSMEEKYKERLCPMDTCDMECQVFFSCDVESSILPNHEVIIVEYKNTIAYLEDEVKEMKTECTLNTDKIECFSRDMEELQKKCDFYESNLSIMEKAKQEVLNENIKITEEAHDLNSLLKQDLIKYQEELSKMKVRLEEAETVERTAQSVIDKYVKECNEAKAKYKRELTLHAADSKLLNIVNKEIEQLRSRDDLEDGKCRQLKQELTFCEQKMEYQLSEMRTQISDIEQQLQEAEYKNDRLYNQLLQISQDSSNNIMNEIIEDLRGQIKVDKLSCSLSNVEKDKYESEIERLQSDLVDMQEQLSMEKDKSSSNISEGYSDSNVETEIIKESNQILREQKLHLDKLVLSQKNEIEHLVNLKSTLKNDLSNLEIQYNTIMSVKSELEEERNRWKDRCTKLIERAEQMDPEKYRIACNDRDRFEKLAIEEGNNLKLVQSELNSKKEEIQGLLNSVVDEQNKKKREETNSENLKKIARKYKDEAAKKNQIILDLQKEKCDLITEKEDVIKKLDEKVSELDSSENLLNNEKNSLLSQIEQMKVEFESTIICYNKEKNELLLKLKLIESELESCLRTLNEINCRCQLLEQNEKEKTVKLQLTESIIVRLKEENKILKNIQMEVTCMKRTNEEKLEDEPDIKRKKFLQEEDISEIVEITESDDKYVEQAEDYLQFKSSENDIIDSSKIWWNIDSNADEELINQIQMNLEEYKHEVEHCEEDSDIQDQHFENCSNDGEESLHICGSVQDEKDVDGLNEVDENDVSDEDHLYYSEEGNDESDKMNDNNEVEEIMATYNEFDESGTVLTEQNNKINHHFYLEEGDTCEDENQCNVVKNILMATNNEFVESGTVVTEQNNKINHHFYLEEGDTCEYDNQCNVVKNSYDENECQYNEEECQFDEERNKDEEDQVIAHNMEDIESSGNESALEQEDDNKINIDELREDDDGLEDCDSDKDSNNSSVVVIEDDTEDESQSFKEQETDHAITIDLNTSEEKEEGDDLVKSQVQSIAKVEDLGTKVITGNENELLLSKSISEVENTVSKRGPIRKLKRRAGY